MVEIAENGLWNMESLKTQDSAFSTQSVKKLFILSKDSILINETLCFLLYASMHLQCLLFT
jgi:hypothetical protein